MTDEVSYNDVIALTPEQQRMNTVRAGLGTTRPPMNRRQRRRAEVTINGQVVRERRRNLGLTQVELAIMAACTADAIAKIEKGRSIDPPTSTTLRLAKALSVTVEALCRGAQPWTSRTTPPRPDEAA